MPSPYFMYFAHYFNVVIVIEACFSASIVSICITEMPKTRSVNKKRGKLTLAKYRKQVNKRQKLNKSEPHCNQYPPTLSNRNNRVNQNENPSSFYQICDKKQRS